MTDKIMPTGPTIRKELTKKFRVYKFKTQEEMLEAKDLFEKFFTKSVSILSSGKFADGNLKHIESLADDYAYMDLKLKLGDPFMITEENELKTSHEERMHRRLKSGVQTTNPKKITKSKITKGKLTPVTKPIGFEKKHGWSGEQLGYLWEGTADEVATKVCKSAASVYSERKKYLTAHPTFVIPDKCKAKKKVEKVEIVWTTQEISLLWSNSARDLKDKFNRSYREIHNLRHAYCVENPTFIIPLVAEFKSDGLLNPVEPKPEKVKKAKEANFWTDDELCVLWDDAALLVASIVGKSYQSVYHRRIQWCIENPSFIIPLKAHFKPPKECMNQVEEVVEVITMVEAAVMQHDAAEDVRHEVTDIPLSSPLKVDELIEAPVASVQKKLADEVLTAPPTQESLNSLEMAIKTLGKPKKLICKTDGSFEMVYD